MSFRKAIAISAGLPLALIALLSGLLCWQIWQTWQALNWVEHTLTVQARAMSVARDLEQMETGQRGILVTGDVAYGGKYMQIRDRIGPQLGNLAWLVSDSQQQTLLARQIRADVSRWDANAQTEIAMRQSHDPRFLSLFEAGKGAVLMGQIRHEVDRFQIQEQALLRARQEAFWRDAERAGIFGGLGLVVVAAFVGLFGFRQLHAFDAAHQELRRRDRELREANEHLQRADNYKDEFLSVISHELRTPLNFITGFASTLEDEVQGPINARQREAIAKILSGSDQMLALVENLLDLARMQSGKLEVAPEPTPYAGLIADVMDHMHPLAEKAGVRLSAELEDPGVPSIDGPRIMQVVTNLVSNAIKFSQPGTEVRIRVGTREGKLLTEVVDQGCGIAESDMPRLFQRFGQLDMSKTRRVGGTGLGLAISRALVEAHGGEIGVYSAGKGEGATFWFTLPCEAAREPLSPAIA